MPEPHPVLPETLAQIRQLEPSSRPLVICDVDEVILHMIRPMEAYFSEAGLRFLEKTYTLSGNIARTGETSPLSKEEVHRLIHAFFDAWVHAQEMVEGANKALRELSDHFDIVLLTNLPGVQRKQTRIDLLKTYDIDYPLLTNSGPKGGAVAALAAGREGPTVFIDDSSLNQASVHASLPGATLIQFIADDTFRQNHAPDDHIDLLTGDWVETTRFIKAIVET